MHKAFFLHIKENFIHNFNWWSGKKGFLAIALQNQACSCYSWLDIDKNGNCILVFLNGHYWFIIFLYCFTKPIDREIFVSFTFNYGFSSLLQIKEGGSHGTYFRWYLGNRSSTERNFGNLICLRHLQIEWTAVVNLSFISKKFSFTRAQPALVYYHI